MHAWMHARAVAHAHEHAKKRMCTMEWNGDILDGVWA